ncbi:kunitz-type serine protease inhibitor 4-like [Emydura macquarii macquarii]|uniref:kunitz-type serine protease inhibitor 4-like n=1 Tax=Emydura macquarii macquarii TaxID=1129001 RepID=UPI00352AD68E
MKSGVLLPLLGLLTLWAELPPASGQIRQANKICNLPMDSGPCFAYFIRYYYNSATKRCEAFVYGGCQGNGNRFATEDECLQTCGQPGQARERPGRRAEHLRAEPVGARTGPSHTASTCHRPLSPVV